MTSTDHMKLEVIYARHVKVGDVVVGQVNLSAPTRPVQPHANGMEVVKVTETPGERLSLHQFHYGSGLVSPSREADDLIMVIR